MKHFETKFARTDLKITFLNFKKKKNNFFKEKLIRNLNLPYLLINLYFFDYSVEL